MTKTNWQLINDIGSGRPVVGNGSWRLLGCDCGSGRGDVQIEFDSRQEAVEFLREAEPHTDVTYQALVDPDGSVQKIYLNELR